MTEFMRPTVTIEEVNDTIARFVVEPLERGYGYTLGNCMRRVLLSSLDGAKATAIQIEGVQHEFTTAEGVIEDITDIVLNVKGLVFSALNSDITEARYDHSHRCWSWLCVCRAQQAYRRPNRHHSC